MAILVLLFGMVFFVFYLELTSHHLILCISLYEYWGSSGYFWIGICCGLGLYSSHPNPLTFTKIILHYQLTFFSAGGGRLLLINNINIIRLFSDPQIPFLNHLRRLQNFCLRFTAAVLAEYESTTSIPLSF